MPTQGEKSTCLDCGRIIEYSGEFWEHVGDNKPRHMPLPAKANLTEIERQIQDSMKKNKENADKARDYACMFLHKYLNIPVQDEVQVKNVQSFINFIIEAAVLEMSVISTQAYLNIDKGE